MKKIILFATAPLALVVGCSGPPADTAADDATATTTEMPANDIMGTTGDAAGTMQSGDTGAAGTGTTGATGTTGSGDTTTDQLGRETGSGTGSANNSSGNTTGGTTPPQ